MDPMVFGSDDHPSVGATDALLVVYGDLRTQGGGRLTGDAILKGLLGNGYWLAARLPKRSHEGIRVLFYQAGSGFTAVAKLAAVEASRKGDWAFAGANMISMFPKKLVLSGAVIFPAPLSAKPLVARLSFIGDKKHWGHAFRLSPRLIPAVDVETVLSAVSG